VYVRVVRWALVGAEKVALAALTFPDFRFATATLDATRAARATRPSQVIRFMSRLPESIGVAGIEDVAAQRFRRRGP
jgi:hypothetical protein